MDGDTVYKNKFFDADFNFFATLAVTENTSVVTKLTFDAEEDPATTNGTSIVPDSAAGDAHAFLGVERAYISTKFLPGLVIDAGLLGGGTWASDFGNTEINVTRIKGTYSVDENIKVIAIYEKYYESTDTILARPAALGGGTAVKATTDFGDTTTYYLAGNIKVGTLTILPLFKYKTEETRPAVLDPIPGNNGDEVITTMGADLGINGDFGMIGFEAEFLYTQVDYDGLIGSTGAYSDETTYGAYVNVFAKLEPATVGLAAIYESQDASDGTFSAGSDFDFVLVAEDCYYGAIAGMTAFKVYASDIKIIDKITADAAFAYGMSTDDAVDDDTFWEVDAAVNYAIDAATTYSIEGGYASIDDDDKADAIAQYRVLQKFAVKF